MCVTEARDSHRNIGRVFPAEPSSLIHHGKLARCLFVCFTLRNSVKFSYFADRFNKYSQIAAQALRASLKEEKRVLSEKRGVTQLRYQKWEDGKGGTQVNNCRYLSLSAH